MTSSPNPTAPADGLAGRAVLVVDDEPHLVQILAFNLRRAGANVITARNGTEALATVARMRAGGVRPDLLITDLQMSGINGLDLCARLRADPDLTALPILLLTARGHRLSQGELDAAGVRRVVSKPFSTADLLAQARSLLPPPPAAAAAA